jgi:rSAM/selenodomain-associated transferase 2
VRISVIIPTLREIDTVARAITSTRQTLDPFEVIVVDAGSDDGTREAARSAGARVILAPGSRAIAMNAGAGVARGDALLFLHADTTLPAGAGDAVRQALRHADGGAFRVRYDDGRPILRTLGDLRLRFLGPVYGDQAIFVTRAVYDQIGGYRPLPIMEDYDFALRLRRAGRFLLLPLYVETAARRHRGHGTLSTLARMWAIQGMYRAGVSPDRLARMYPPAR